jgi:hypothetical protein
VIADSERWRVYALHLSFLLLERNHGMNIRVGGLYQNIGYKTALYDWDCQTGHIEKISRNVTLSQGRLDKGEVFMVLEIRDYRAITEVQLVKVIRSQDGCIGWLVKDDYEQMKDWKELA